MDELFEQMGTFAAFQPVKVHGSIFVLLGGKHGGIQTKKNSSLPSWSRLSLKTVSLVCIPTRPILHQTISYFAAKKKKNYWTHDQSNFIPSFPRW